MQVMQVMQVMERVGYGGVAHHSPRFYDKEKRIQPKTAKSVEQVPLSRLYAANIETHLQQDLNS